MENLQVTAYLSNGIAVYDDWSPNLEALLIYEFLTSRGLSSPNPSLAQIEEQDSLIKKELPIKSDSDHSFFYCSAPVYKYKEENQSRYRKRWTPDQDGRIEWGKRKAKFSTSEGPEKSYDLPLFIRLTPRIDWFCIGDKKGIVELLKFATGLGKKRSLGFGQVAEWVVTPIEHDWSLQKNGKLMKPLPPKIAQEIGVTDFHDMMLWGWRPPAWFVGNKVLCMMPNLVSHVA